MRSFVKECTLSTSLGNIVIGVVVATAPGLWVYAGTTADPQRVVALVATAQRSAAASDLVRFELAKTPAPTIWQLSTLRRQADQVLALDASKSGAGIPSLNRRNPL